MSPDLSMLLLATAVFVGGHLTLSSLPVRRSLAGLIGEGGHRGVYSLVALGSLVWMILVYPDAQADAPILWIGPPIVMMAPVAVMPIVSILVVCALTSRNPTAIGGEKLAHDPAPPQGIVTVTRHPLMVAFALFAAVHIAPNGDLASVVLFGGLLILAMTGMLHIDHRRRETLGSGWGPIALTTGIIPFSAAVQGRTKIDWAGIGPWRVVAGLALYAALLYGHGWIIGVDILPG